MRHESPAPESIRTESTLGFQDMPPVAGSDGIVSDSADRLKAELVRKEKLLGQVDTYLAKNIAERIRSTDDKSADAEYMEKLDSGYAKMMVRGDDLEERISAIREVIGADSGKDISSVPETESPVADSPIPVRERSLFGRVFFGFRESVRKTLSGFKERFSRRGNADEDLVVPVGMLPSDRKPTLPIIGKLGVDGAAKYRSGDIAPVGWGAIEKASDPYAVERYPREAGVSDKKDAPIDPDASLVRSDTESSEYGQVKNLRERDRMGFLESYPEEPAKVDMDEWLEKKRVEMSDVKAFGSVSKDRYRVEEMGAVKAMENVAVIRTAFEDAERMMSEHPDLMETYAVQRDAVGRAYEEALGVARFALAAELRGEPEGEHRKSLMRDFSSVMAELRRLVGPSSETSVSEDSPERKAA
jgi:hypothetical protein